MKKTALILLCVVMLVFLFGCSTDTFGAHSDEMRAIWLSQYDMFEVYTDTRTQRDVADYTARVQRVLDNVVSCGFNTVFLQLRPFGDSICRSSIYPTSYILTGDYSRAASYDAVEILLSEARARGLSVHAWINPLRTVRDGDFERIGGDYMIKRWYSDPAARGKYLVRVGERWYLNPAYECVRELIISGAEEILSLYSFDGIHIDDYFYPTDNESFDSAAYAEYVASGGEASLGDFRRDAINQLVKGLFDASHKHGAIFGIAPSSVAESAYVYQYADVYLWCAEEGYADYVCPQVYFGFEHETCPFRVICDEWESYVRGSDVTLIIGIGAYKAYFGRDGDAGRGSDEWIERDDVLARSVRYARTLEGCGGVGVFSYQYLYSPASGDPVEKMSPQREALTAEFRKFT